jgi:hypothetical protein
MTTRSFAFGPYLRHASLPAFLAGAMLLAPRLAKADGIQRGTVATERTTASAETNVSVASGRSSARSNGGETSRVVAIEGVATSATANTNGRAAGLAVSASASRSDRGEHSRAVVGGRGVALTMPIPAGDDDVRFRGAANVDDGEGQAHSWDDGDAWGSSARVFGRGVAGVRHGPGTDATAEGVGTMSVRASVSSRAAHKSAEIVGTGTVRVARIGHSASARVTGGRARLTSHAGPSGSHSTGFRIGR